MSSHRTVSKRDDEDRIICPIDGIAVVDHPRCCLCKILCGPGHYEQTGYTIGERLVCRDCAIRLSIVGKR